MAKRSAEDDEDGGIKLADGERPRTSEGGDESLDYADEFEDEYESEDEVFEAGVDGRPDNEREAEERRDAMDVDLRTFIPGRDKLQPGEVLSPDLTTYEMFHTLSTTWPCLSFDIIKDSLGDNRKSYPATLYAVAGTQAESRRSKENELIVMKLSGLSRTDQGAEGSDSEDDDDDEPSEPILETKTIRLPCTTNRIRALQTPPSNSSRPPTTYTATMLENAQLLVHNITPHLTSFDQPGTTITPAQSRPLATLTMHKTEGYALAWSPQGKLLSGDNAGNIYLTTLNANATPTTDPCPFTGHTGSVEDLQWSPNQPQVFASASSDGTVKIWRLKSHTPMCNVRVSATDVNVLSWSHLDQKLLATGADDGVWTLWDMSQWDQTPAEQAPKPLASFNFHKEQITSVEWHPTDNSLVAVAAGDNTLTLWDIATEIDRDESADEEGADVSGVPPQVLFIHVLEQVKEAHWHAQIPGCVVGTGGGGFGVFKTISEVLEGKKQKVV